MRARPHGHRSLAVLALLAGLLWPATTWAQVDQLRVGVGRTEITWKPLKAASGTTDWENITRYGVETHHLVYTVTGAPSAVSVALQCSNNGGASSTSTIGTATTTTGDATVSGDATCTHVRISYTITGGTSPQIIPVWSGNGSGSVGDVTVGDISLDLTATNALLTTIAGPVGTKAPGTAGATSQLTGCVYTAAGVTLTTGQQVALQCNSTGQLITSGSGGGGGTQYTEGDTDSTITGTALMFEGGSNTLVAAPGTAANGLLVDVSRVTGNVAITAAALPLPSGAATSAKQPALGTAGAPATDVITAQGAASMTPFLVTLNGTNNVNNISGTISLPTGAATSTNQATEVTALQLIDNPVGSLTGGTAGSSSFAAGGIYNSSAPTLTNGQQAALQLDAAGRVIVSIGAGAGTGGFAAADNSTFTLGTTSLNPSGLLYEASPTTRTTGKVTIPGGTIKGAARMALEDATTGVPFAQDTQAVFGAAPSWTAATGPTGGFGFWCRVNASDPSTSGVGEDDVIIPHCNNVGALHTIIDSGGTAGAQYTEGDTDASITGTALMFEGAANALVAAPGTAANGLLVDVSRVTGTVTVSGTVTVTDGAGALNVIIDSGTTAVTHTALTALGTTLAVAHSDVDAGNGFKLAAKAIAFGTNPTGVSAADRTDLYSTRAGQLFTIGGHPNPFSITALVSDSDGPQTGTKLVDCGSGCKVALTHYAIRCSNADSGNIDASIFFSTTTTQPMDAVTGAAGVPAQFYGLPPGGGEGFGGGDGILGIGADGEDLRYTVTDPVGGHCNISVTGFTIES